MTERLTIEFDGGSRGNPGPAGVGVVVRAEDGTPLVTLGRFIGRATNNVAEYKALIAGLREARRLGARRVRIRGDSELIIKQMRGEYRVRHPDMKPLYEEAVGCMREFDEATITHNLRHKNELADRLANLAMDRKAEVTDVDDPPASSAAAMAPVRWECPGCGCAIEVRRPPRTGDPAAGFVCVCGRPMQGTR